MSKVDISKATPRPWFVEGTLVYALEQDGWRGGKPAMRNRFSASMARGPATPDAELEANAELVRRAVNSYDAMLAALKQVRALVGEGATTGFNPLDGDWADRLYANNADLTRAIRLAEGKEPAA